VYSGVFEELKKTIAMSAMDIIMLPCMEWSGMIVAVAMCIVGEGVEVAVAIVGEAIVMPDIFML
jgi:hypothetical protein